MIWIGLIIAGVIAATVALSVAGAYFWNKLGPSLTDWLHRHNLQQSQLTNVFIQVDRFLSTLRCKLFVTQKGVSQSQVVTQENVRREDLPADVREQMDRVLAQGGVYTETVLVN